MSNEDNLEIKDILKSEVIEEQKKEKEKKKNSKEKNEEKKINKLNKKNSDNMNFLNIEKEEAINQVLNVSYNNDYNYICLGTLTCFKIFSLKSLPIKLIYEYQFNPVEPIKIIEMVESSQLVILVGQKNSIN